MKLRGTVCVFGDNVNTDEIIAARYLNTTDPAVLAQHCMEDVRPGFARRITPGQIMWPAPTSDAAPPASTRRSPSRPPVSAAWSPRALRVSSSETPSTSGLPIVECPGISAGSAEGDRIEVDLDNGALVLPAGERRPITPFPPFMQAIIEEGGWIPYLLSRKSMAEG